MGTEHQEAGEVMPEWIARLEALRQQPGPVAEFWPAYLGCLARAVDGAASVLLAPTGSDDGPAWRVAWEWKNRAASESLLGLFRGRYHALAQQCGRERISQCEPLGATGEGNGWIILTVPLLPGQGEPAGLALVLTRCGGGDIRAALLERLRLIADVPGSAGLRRALADSQAEKLRFGATLDLLLQLDRERNFQSAAMLLCNALAIRHDCTRVCLGWERGSYIRLQAVSRIEKFEKKMSIARAIEAAMEEAADQDCEIVWPADAGDTLILRDHERFAADQRSGHLCSVPLRTDAGVVGVVLLERETRPFDGDEVRQLRLCADQVAGRLVALHASSRWVGARAWDATRHGLRKLLGVEHTLAKTVALVTVCLFAFLVFGRMDHRVRAPFTLRGDELRLLPAPFDGFVGEVRVGNGEEVAEGAVLLRLDTAEILLERTELLAEETRHLREVQKAESAGALADMQIAQARLEQTRARLGIIEHRLQRAEVRAPMDGIVVEGDWRERIGGPVRQGEPLFRVARLEKLYAEVRVPEADIHRIRGGGSGRITFTSRPGERIPVEIDRIEPMAQADPEGNHFIVRCVFPDPPMGWWRPGMEGSARIDAGRRSPGYVLTYRTVDFLRLRFW
jgi:multidrug efflux pump subunit AcrA (membrane-fusion protein)